MKKTYPNGLTVWIGVLLSSPLVGNTRRDRDAMSMATLIVVGFFVPAYLFFDYYRNSIWAQPTLPKSEKKERLICALRIVDDDAQRTEPATANLMDLVLCELLVSFLRARCSLGDVWF